ncbi:hypothetical protein D3C87_2155980 [compost metagenome]
MDLCTRFGDRLHYGGVTGYVLGNVLNNGESGHHAQLLFRQRGMAGKAGGQQQTQQGERAEVSPVLNEG